MIFNTFLLYLSVFYRFLNCFFCYGFWSILIFFSLQFFHSFKQFFFTILLVFSKLFLIVLGLFFLLLFIVFWLFLYRFLMCFTVLQKVYIDGWWIMEESTEGIFSFYGIALMCLQQCLKLDFQRNCWWKLNNLNNQFLMKSHWHSVRLLELHQCWCKWGGLEIKASLETTESHMVSHSHLLQYINFPASFNSIDLDKEVDSEPIRAVPSHWGHRLARNAPVEGRLRPARQMVRRDEIPLPAHNHPVQHVFALGQGW